MTREEALRWAVWGVLALAVGLAWQNGLHGEFVYDDKVEVVGNRTLRFLEEWRTLLAYNWSRALLVLSFALNYAWAGLDPWPYHVVNVGLQAANAGLAMLLGAELGRARGLGHPLRFGALSAALWALHPLATESVTYISSRSELLCGFFGLLGGWAWLRWRLDGGMHRFALALGATGLAMFSKEVAVTFPVAYLLLEWLGVRGGRLREVRWVAYLPWVAALGAFFAFRVQLYGDIIGHTPVQRPPGQQLLTQAEVLWRYVGLWAWPQGQSVFHDHAVTGLTLRSGLAAAGWVVVVGAALLGARRAPVLALGGLWFLLILAPSSSVLPLKETMAEHRAYLALLGLCWMAAWGLERLPRLPRALVWVGLLGACVGLTRTRNAVWATEVGVWEEATRLNPASAPAWYALGDAYRVAQRPADAARCYAQAVELDPGFADARNNLGLALAQSGDPEAAEATWRELLRRTPSFCRAHNNLGLLYARQSRWEAAAGEFRTTLAYCPQDCRAHRYLGELYGERLGDRQKAVLHLELFLELCPADTQSAEVRALLNRLTW